MRDLVRACEAAKEALKRARQPMQLFLLRQRIYTERSSWTNAHKVWVCVRSSSVRFIKSCCGYHKAIDDAEVRRKRLAEKIAEMAANWSMAPVVDAFRRARRALHDSSHLRDRNRQCEPLRKPRQLMAYLGLVPSDESTGERVHRKGVTKQITIGCAACSLRAPGRIAILPE